MLLKLDLQRFAGNITYCTINFDSHITKVTLPNSDSITTSGDSKGGSFTTFTGTYTVELEEGYVIDNVTVTNGTLDSKTDNTFTITANDTGEVWDITITSKQSSSTTKLIKIKFKDTLTLTTFDVSINFRTIITIDDTIEYTNYVGIKCESSNELVYVDSDGGEYAVYQSDNWGATEDQVIEIDPTQANFQSFITAMKDNIEGVELEAGTYVWVNNPTTNNIEFDVTQCSLNFSSNNQSFNNIYFSTLRNPPLGFVNYMIYNLSSTENINVYNFDETTWSNENYKTITTTENQYIGYDFYNYAILGNQLVKQTVPTSGETWVLNESLGMDTLSKTNVTFTSNNENFVGIAYSTSSMGPQTLWYYKNDTEYVVVCEYGTYSNQAYRIIKFNNAPTGNLLTWLQANGTKQGSTPTYSFKHWKKSNVVVNRTLVGQKYYFFKPYTILGLYTITTTLTNCSGATANATKIQENGGLTLTFTANSGYELPTGVSVTNVTSYNWNKSTGVLAISKPTGDVTIEIVAVSALPQLATPTNVAVTDTTLTFDEVANATSYEVFVDNVSIGTHTMPSVISLKWKFNGTKVSIPQLSYDNSFAIGFDVYNNDTLVETNLNYVYFNDNYTYMAFGMTGYWDTTNNQYGGGNIILFKTEPSGFLLQFLQEHCVALN